MSPAPDKFDFSHLSVDERLSLIEALCDSLSPEDVTLTKEQCDELDSRQAAMDAGILKTSSWEEVKQRLKLDT